MKKRLRKCSMSNYQLSLWNDGRITNVSASVRTFNPFCVRSDVGGRAIIMV